MPHTDKSVSGLAINDMSKRNLVHVLDLSSIGSLTHYDWYGVRSLFNNFLFCLYYWVLHWIIDHRIVKPEKMFTAPGGSYPARTSKRFRYRQLGVACELIIATHAVHQSACAVSAFPPYTSGLRCSVSCSCLDHWLQTVVLCGLSKYAARVPTKKGGRYIDSFQHQSYL